MMSMKHKIDKKYWQIGMCLFLTALAIMLTFFVIYRFKSIKEGISTLFKILAPLIYGLILAYVMTPLLNFYENRLVIPSFKKFKLFKNSSEKSFNKKARTTSVTITLLSVLLILYLFFAAVIPQVYKSIQSIVSNYSVYSNNLYKWLMGISKKNPEISRILSRMIKNYSSETDDWLSDQLLPAIQTFFPDIKTIAISLSESLIGFGKFIWNFVIGLIISLYVLASKEKFAKSSTKLLYATFENRTANVILEATRFTHHKFIGFLSGKVVDSLIIGMLCFIVCTILQMPYTVLISIIVGVTNIIPFFGPWFGAIPSLIIILMVDPKKALIFLIFICVLQQIDGNIIGPKILSESTGLSSFWIIISITIFGGLFGVPGMIIAVPLTAVLFAGINSLANKKLVNKSLPVEEDFYKEIGSISEEGEVTPYEYVEPPKKKPSKSFVKFISIFKKKSSNNEEKEN